MSCELCDLIAGNLITKKYHEDEQCIIVDCATCGPDVPMVVYKKHERHPADLEEAQMIRKLIDIADKAFGRGCWKLDDEMKKIPDHWHCHARPVGRSIARRLKIQKEEKDDKK